MQGSGQLHALATLSRGKEPSASTEWEAGVGLEISLDVLANRKTSHPDHTASSTVTTATRLPHLHITIQSTQNNDSP